MTKIVKLYKNILPKTLIFFEQNNKYNKCPTLNLLSEIYNI